MAEDNVTTEVDPRLVERIVSSYVLHHRIGVDQLPGLIAEVHRSLAKIGQRRRPEEARAMAVPVRRSVQRDYVVCLDCGYRAVMLRKHIRVVHGLEPAAYRDRWKLSANHPLTAPSHSARRSALAKQFGLGHLRPRKAVAPEPATPPCGVSGQGAHESNHRPRRKAR